MKTIFKILVVVVVLLAIALVFGILHLDKGIKTAVETLGPKLTQSSVTLDDVDLSLSTGEGSLSGLVIGNPAGFKSANAFSLGKIALAIDTQSITTETIVVKKLHIIAPQITYEQGSKGSNIAQLQRNVEQAAGSGKASPEPESEAESGASKKLIIRDLQITDGNINYSNPLLSGEHVSLQLPAVKLTGIGEKSNGATAAEVTEIILAAINKSAATAISNSDLVDDLKADALEKGKSKLEETLGDKLGGFKGLLDKD